MRKYLVIKNTIISLLLTVMFLGWLVEGLRPIKMIVASIVAFVLFMNLLQTADKHYMECIGYSEKEKSA